MQTFYFPNGRFMRSAYIRKIAESASEPYVIFCLKPDIRWVYRGQERMVQVMQMTGAVMAYSDRFIIKKRKAEPAPTIDYQEGALRDDFETGAVMIWRTDILKSIAQQIRTDYEYAGLYDLRLRASEIGQIVHIPEFLYYEREKDLRKSGEKLFDYVDPRNRNVQIEMEHACTEHLKRIGAFIDYNRLKSFISKGDYPVTASVIIPCKNRVRTIGDAIRSALSQRVRDGYSMNVIVVDDNSNDGTKEVIESFNDDRLVYIAQDKSWHAIGGNWNMALHDSRCGKYAIQLDSDDTYYDTTTVQRFIDMFEQGQYGMVIGSYQLTDIEGNPLPPGIIDHREWTEENGMNNALRINGLGAPRAFCTELMREIDFPTTKYGEDYAVGLRISREWRIGRIYDVMYNCRRWDDNSDANCDIETMNRNNLYKDRLRTWEIAARKQ